MAEIDLLVTLLPLFVGFLGGIARVAVGYLGVAKKEPIDGEKVLKTLGLGIVVGLFGVFIGVSYFGFGLLFFGSVFAIELVQAVIKFLTTKPVSSK